MNTERPDNDAPDDEGGAAESADARDAAGSGAGGGEGAVPEASASSQADAEKADDGKAEAGQADPGKAETGQADPGKAETGQADPGKAETGQADPGKAETGQADARKADAAAGDDTAGGDDALAGAAASEESDAVPESDAAEVAALSDEGLPAAGPATGTDSTDSGAAPVEVPGPHEVDAPSPSRRRSPVLIASVAAAVLLVGGGGAYLAASASGGSGGGTNSGASGDGSTPPPLALDGYSQGGTNGIAPGEPNPYGVKYKLAGSLPDGPGSAPVYRATGEVTKDEVARLAKALGLDGAPVAQGQAWQVGPSKDGSGPSLVVDKQAPGTWTFHRYAAGTDACQSVIACTKDPANPAGATVSEAAAKKAAAPVLKAAGQDDAKVDASQVMGAQRVVNANPLVGGLPTYGWTTGLTVSAQGEVVGGSGLLKAPVKGDIYPVLGAQKTLDMMNSAPTTDHRMGIGGCASPVPLKDRLEAPCGQSTPGATATPAKETVTIQGAVFGLAVHTVNGRQALVPSWLFQVKGAGAQNGFTVTYPAVDPKYLASNSPSGAPTPSASAPSGQPTSAPATRDVTVQSYSADGKALTVDFTGGVCGDYAAKASESADKVTVTVTETPWRDKICIMIAKEMTRTVQLDEPLGDRKVVGSDGKEIPLPNPGQRLPRTTAGVQ